jgi:hypothetical protein
MGYDFVELKFCGLASTIAIEEFSASFNDCRDNSLLESMYKEYLSAGGSGDQGEWIRQRPGSLFECVGPRPRWVERSPQWPFMNGRPMTFISQLAIEANSVALRKLSPGSVIYVFGARVQRADVDGWELV